ncbi:hypothetical protein B0H11DRAFT_61771 [Mycena galericulata]|nr:hypothetical protein B0H11DRAFT_61771 [Mycena galericulata]
MILNAHRVSGWTLLSRRRFSIHASSPRENGSYVYSFHRCLCGCSGRTPAGTASAIHRARQPKSRDHTCCCGGKRADALRLEISALKKIVQRDQRLFATLQSHHEVAAKERDAARREVENNVREVAALREEHERHRAASDVSVKEERERLKREREAFASAKS